MKNIILIAIIAGSTSLVMSSCGNSSASHTVFVANTDSSMVYSCAMHQQVISKHPGDCPKCGMTLLKQKVTADQQKMLRDGNYIKPKD